MSTQVRTFTAPKPLGESLSSAASIATNLQSPYIPRSVPTYPDIPRYNAGGSRAQIKPSSMSAYVNDQAGGNGGITFAHQDSLPKLPIPELESTLQKYLTVLRPLQTTREHAETRIAVEEFLRQDGPELQEKLKKYAEGRTSYIEQFWYDSYLNYDNPVVLNLNPFFLLEDDPTPARNNQVNRAASLIVSSLMFVRAVRKEELPPDTIRGTPLDMYQYSRLFGTARVPTDNGCQIEQDPESKHIVVMCHGQFYWFDVLDDNSDLIMTERDVALNLQTIIGDATQTPIQEAAKGALGVLSTENRKVWSGLRDVLTREEGSNNADCLSIVDSALFVVCLDYTEPASAAAVCQNMLCGTSDIEKGVQIGTCTNRWYDKLQIIVCKNGSAGINFEHTGVDGHTVLRFASDVYTDTILRFARSINGQAPSMWKSTSPDPARRDPESFGDVTATPHKLEWDMVPELTIAVRFAESRLADLIEQNEFQCLDFGAYGKNFITSMGFSPDAFVQMAFQAAYYGLYGRVECTYEPAMTKVYLHGRTEAIRSVTEESVHFVQTFWADNQAELKVEALRRACQRHVTSTRECSKAQGCDRHLYALFCLWQRLADDELFSNTGTGTSSADYGSSFGSERGFSPVPEENGSVNSHGNGHVNGNGSSSNETPARARGDSTGSRQSGQHMPAIFLDSGWDKLNTTILSTSNCGNPSLRQFGFGPVSGDGFGIGYIIKDDGISICVSSKHRQTKRFVDTLESYLLEMRRVLRITSRRLGSISSKQMSRAREIDNMRPRPPTRVKSRGRLITGGDVIKSMSRLGTESPTTDSMAMSEDDELGGYGFFDAGMLLQALKARNEGYDLGEPKPSERASRRRDIGKKLRLIDY
ncbi:carnitine acetyl transferase [Grosmannia clavigera kw1407]|uniref:Carnitine acetyl transferase n=1 Tax=Grosmannia clavigera (strain kw1407 / UAMH 11150) TaxID=655863 RepID=F0XA60_GROCL|nr:carnitine acetyl transferase [Grosmannia clavigera kw1407]EFX06125.1 carnitine acetyl transferase [Grosmannia clavigera kw1407]